MVHGRFGYLVLLENGNSFIHHLLQVHPRQGGSAEACRQYCERVTIEMIVLRRVLVNGNEVILMEWCVDLARSLTDKIDSLSVGSLIHERFYTR